MSNKILCCVLLVAFSVMAQKLIPTPEGCTMCGTTYDRYIAGDYDGDGANDLFLVWKTDDVRSIYTCAVYSYVKSQYLLNVGASDYRGQFLVGDLNNDKVVEWVIGNKVYSNTTAIQKKKQ